MTEGHVPGGEIKPGAGFDQPLGEEEGRRYEEAVEHQTYTDVDFEGNELRAAGQKCARCGRVIAPEDDVPHRERRLRARGLPGPAAYRGQLIGDGRGQPRPACCATSSSRLR
jgi:hypothetical protein